MSVISGARQALTIIKYKIKYSSKLVIGSKFRFRSMFNLNINGGNVIIGNNVFFNKGCSINSQGLIKIGDNCIFGENVKIYDHNHKFRDKNLLIRNQKISVGNIEIGKNCWIGSNVVLLKGCKIGNNVIIGAGCVISEIIPDNMVIKVSSNSYDKFIY